MSTRIEKDSLGKVNVANDRYWGAQTQRSLQNFKIGNEHFPREFIRAYGILKKAAATVNESFGNLNSEIASTIRNAADEVVEGKLDDHFPLVVWQTGSGTQTNMNVNEVIANRAIEMLGGELGSKDPVHPNDHVNMSQSTNDTFPSTINIAAVETVAHQLIPALEKLQKSLTAKADEFNDIIKLGRTHLQDATPLSLGQEFSGYASMVDHGITRVKNAIEHCYELAMGGTAVGTGINSLAGFGEAAAKEISNLTGFPFVTAPNKFEALGGQDSIVELSSALKTVAVSLNKIANDIRWLGSGPRAGIGELIIPTVQPGSSIMPGKVNPVICESMMQICAQVIGNDTSITIGGQGGVFELNLMLPLIAHNLTQSIEILSTGSQIFTNKLIKDLKANENTCAGYIEDSLAMCTSLAPIIGYDRAAEIAHKAHESGKTVREIAIEENVLDIKELEKILHPESMTKPNT